MKILFKPVPPHPICEKPAETSRMTAAKFLNQVIIKNLAEKNQLFELNPTHYK